MSILFPTEKFGEDVSYYKKMTKRQRSQNISSIQYDIINGLMSNNETPPWIINTLLVPLFPQGYKLPVIKRKFFKGRFCGITYSFINCPFIYSSSLFYGAKKYLRSWARQDKGKEKVIIAYSLTTYTLKAMNYVKKINPDIKTIIIVPDLPQYTYRHSNNIVIHIKNLLGKKKVLKCIDKYSAFTDGWLLFSEHMKKEIPNCNKYMVFEGVATDIFSSVDSHRIVSENNYEILYGGGLNKNYGLQTLLDAFSLIKDSRYKLVLAGKGDMQEEIIKRKMSDNRIIYLGEIPREKLLELEKGADLLVNPRTNSGIFTKYSFPSKNMEYLSSGVPMLGYKLEGIPREYDEFINYFKESTAESLSQAIIDICTVKKEISIQKANVAKEFVLNNKNKTVWGNKIFQFIKNI